LNIILLFSDKLKMMDKEAQDLPNDNGDDDEERYV
jgi:hypothetical protein